MLTINLPEFRFSLIRPGKAGHSPNSRRTSW
jgi:hypothetical protein